MVSTALSLTPQRIRWYPPPLGVFSSAKAARRRLPAVFRSRGTRNKFYIVDTAQDLRHNGRRQNFPGSAVAICRPPSSNLRAVEFLSNNGVNRCSSVGRTVSWTPGPALVRGAGDMRLTQWSGFGQQPAERDHRTSLTYSREGDIAVVATWDAGCSRLYDVTSFFPRHGAELRRGEQ